MTAVGVIGCGRVGLPLALAAAFAGHTVRVWDESPDVRDMLRGGPLHASVEPAAAALLPGQRLLTADSAEDLAAASQVVFLAVPGEDSEGYPDPERVLAAVRAVGRTARRPTIVLTSTSRPQMCDTVYAPAVAAAVGTPLIYWPIIGMPGRMLEAVAAPAPNMVGTGGGPLPAQVAALLGTLTATPPAVMRYVDVEVAAMTACLYAAAKVAAANMTARLCAAVGADVDQVVDAVGAYPHVGAALFEPGVGWGGPYWTQMVRMAGWFPEACTYAGAVTSLNIDHAMWVRDVLLQHGCRNYAVIGRSETERYGEFVGTIDQLLDDIGVAVEPHVAEAEAVIIAQPLQGVRLCEHLKPECVVVDLYRTHPYLANCGARYIPLGPIPAR